MKKSFDLLSYDKIHTLRGVVYIPDGEIRGAFQVVHGMTDHIARYDRIMSDMCERGYLCFGYDHLGHGNTARDESELGYFAERDGWDIVCRDVGIFSEAVLSEYSPEGERLPYYLLGHSMGSFIVRLAAERYVRPDKLIIMGTSGNNPIMAAGLAAARLCKALCGEKKYSPLLNSLAFGSYNKKFGGGTESDPSPWLNSIAAEREKYYADPFCTFKFTNSAMCDLVLLNKNCNRAEWYKNIPAELPILLVAGEMDPVGNYGEGVRQVCVDLNDTGHKVSCIIYPDARHEILNDCCYEQVKTDIIEFLECENEDN